MAVLMRNRKQFYSTCAIQLQGSRNSACARTQTNSEHSSMLLIKLCNCRFIVVAIYVSNLSMSSSVSTDVTSSLGCYFLLSFTFQDPLFSSAQQQWIQLIITAQTAQRNDHDNLESVTSNLSTALSETSTSTELPIVTSTIENVGSYTMTQLI